jgi:tetratricopeptide (TPR) repeat protein
MKHITMMNRTALLSLLSLGLGASAVQAEETAAQTPQSNPTPTVIEDSDPFDKSTGKPGSKAAKDQSAEMLDAQARILFARGETEKAVALQKQAVDKAKDTALELAETLAKYEGRAFDRRLSLKLDEIIIPRIDFQDTKLDEAIDFLRVIATELDLAETDPAKKGVNFVVRKIMTKAPVTANGQPAESNAFPSPVINELRLRNVPLGVVLMHICEATNYRLTIDRFAVTLDPGC